MFERFIGKSEESKLASEVAPYRNMAIEVEVDQLLTEHELELTGYNRHLLTSNDRYQMSTVYLALARDRSILMNSIYDHLTSNADEVRTKEYDVESVKRFLISGYNSAKRGIETADEVFAQTGYQASQGEVSNLRNFYDSGVKWPGTEGLSNLFLEGGIEAIDNMLATVFVQASTITKNELLPNDFRIHLSRKIEPMLAKADRSKKAIDRVIESAGGKIESRTLMTDIYQNIQEAYALLEEVEIWLAIPKLNDHSYTLREPLNESRPGQKTFDPSLIARPIVPQVIARPRPVDRPFTIDSLTPPPMPVDQPNVNPGVSRPDLPKRTFDPASLSPSSPGKGFDASMLMVPANPKHKAPKREFDPKLLDN